MKNKIGYLGLLGLLGTLGFLNQNVGFYGFFGFFGFFGFANITPDEMFKYNVNRAAKNAFFSGVITYTLFMASTIFISYVKAYSFGFAIGFAIQIWVFSVSLAIYEKNGVK